MKIYGPRSLTVLRRGSAVLYLFGDNHAQRLTAQTRDGFSVIDFCRALGRFRLLVEGVSTGIDPRDLRWISRLSVAFPQRINLNAIRESVPYSMLGYALRQFVTDKDVFPILRDLCRSIGSVASTEPILPHDRAFLEPYRRELEAWLVTPVAREQQRLVCRFCGIVVAFPDHAPDRVEQDRLSGVLRATDDLLSRMESYYNRVMEAYLIHLVTRGAPGSVDVAYVGENHTTIVAEHLVHHHGYDSSPVYTGRDSGMDQYVILPDGGG